MLLQQQVTRHVHTLTLAPPPTQMASSDGGLPQQLMSSEGDGGEEISRTMTFTLTTGQVPDQMAVALATEGAARTVGKTARRQRRLRVRRRI